MSSKKLLAVGAGWVCATGLAFASQTVTYTCAANHLMHDRMVA